MDSADYANDTREELILHAVEILIAVRQGRGQTAVFTELAERFARGLPRVRRLVAPRGRAPR